MIKLNQSGSANVNVLGEDQLGQVVGGHGHRGYRKSYDHCYKNRRYNDCYKYEGGYESKGSSDYCYDSDSSEYSYDDSYDSCERSYS